MSLARYALRTAVLAAVALGPDPAAGSPAAPPSAPGKPAEASTVGTAAPVLTAAERLKLALAEREWAARRARPAAAARPAPVLPPELRLRPPPFETRLPAAGLRLRTKPIQGAAPAGVAAGEKGGGR